MSEDFQSHRAALAPGISAADEGFEATREHGEYSFDLNAISISGQVAAGSHLLETAPTDTFILANRTADETVGHD